VFLLNKSIFSLIVPTNKIGSCGMIAILVLKSSRPIFDTSMPSIKIFPSAASTILSNEISKVDLPLPVRPTMPIFSFGFMLIVTFFRTSTPYSWYLRTTFENFMFPDFGQPVGGRLSGIIAGDSC